MNNIWRPIDEAPKYETSELLLYSKELIDEEFNPEGVVVGYWQDGEGWIGAVWNGDQDCWDAIAITPTLYSSKPTIPGENYG